MSAEDEWTLVTSKKPHKSTPRTLISQNHTQTYATSPAESVNSKEVGRAHARLNRCIEKLKDTSFVSHVRSSFGSSHPGLLLKSQCPTRAVIAGLGNLDGTADRDVWRATWQLAVFLQILEGLSGHNENEASQLPIYAQDPAFTATDSQVLADLSISVVPVPDAITQVDERTLLFVPFVDVVVLLPEILKGKDPLIYIGSDITDIIEKISERGYAER
jgi:flagellar biosynthesis protein FliQ